MIIKRFILVSVCLGIVVGCSSFKQDDKNAPPLPSIPKVAFVITDTTNLSKAEKNDLASIKHSVSVAGIPFTEINASVINKTNLSDYTIVILPYPATKSLSKEAVEKIKQAVDAGTNLLFDNDAKLAAALNIKLLPAAIPVSIIRDIQFPTHQLFWTDTLSIIPIDTTNPAFTVLDRDDSTELALAVTGKYGKGQFIFYATLFDAKTDKGYSRFPYLIEAINSYFGKTTFAERNAAEMFYDAGLHKETENIDSMARLWHTRGIKRLYAGGWYFDYGYDYKKLIDACHAHGIMAYCWLETPMVTEEFWGKHPQWREKTATLRDGAVDWRLLMNLADTACRRQVFIETKNLLMNFDWDGVNLAELYFDPTNGAEDPKNFTPMNDIVRKEFAVSSGFDPIKLFDKSSSHYWKTNTADWTKFVNYRKDLCYRLKIAFLDFLSGIQKSKSDFELMLTAIDVSLTPEVSNNIAEETSYTLALYKKYGFAMQIEDPSTCWGSTPERYDKLGKLYRQSVKEQNKLIFDCNVVGSHEKGYGGFPSEKPSGEEIRQIAYNMALNNSRPAFYAEDALYHSDFANISSVLARNVKITAESKSSWTIDAPFTVLVYVGKAAKAFLLDNKPWFAGDEDGYILIPAGVHHLETLTQQKEPSAFSIVGLSSELVSAQFGTTSLAFWYDEEINACYVMLNKLPKTIKVDGKPIALVYFASGNEYSVKLPLGKHSVVIE